MFSWFTLAALKKTFSGLLKQPLFYVALVLLAVGGGTYFYLKHATAQQVEAAVKGADAKATIDTYQTVEEAEAALEPLEQKAEVKAEQTRKGYENARRKVYSAPQPERTTRAPALIVSTLNDLERMSRERDADRVPDAEVQGSGTGVSGSASRPASGNNH